MYYEIYFDGGITKNPGGDITIGGIIYEVDGEKKEVIYQYSEKLLAKEFKGQTSNNTAEALSLSKALSFFYCDSVFDKMINVYGDSQIIINRCIRKKRGGNGLFVPYCDNLIDSVILFSDINFTWIPREQNTEADSLT